jgi:hypothetical protein
MILVPGGCSQRRSRHKQQQNQRKKCFGKAATVKRCGHGAPPFFSSSLISFFGLKLIIRQHIPGETREPRQCRLNPY